MNEDCIHFQAFLGSLMGDKVVADHLPGELLDFLRGLDNLNTALESATKVSYAEYSGYPFHDLQHAPGP